MEGLLQIVQWGNVIQTCMLLSKEKAQEKPTDLSIVAPHVQYSYRKWDISNLDFYVHINDLLKTDIFDKMLRE